jgi:hypothetical protein
VVYFDAVLSVVLSVVLQVESAFGVSVIMGNICFLSVHAQLCLLLNFNAASTCIIFLFL